MNTIKMITLSKLLIATTSLIAMEQAPQVSPRHSIAHLSGGSASPALLERLEYVKRLMVERNLLDKNSHVWLGYLNEQALGNLEKDGCSIRYNALTNGIDSILVEKHLEDLPKEQQDAALAHELAHIALRQKRAAHLNPHNLLNDGTIAVAEISGIALSACGVLSIISSAINKPVWDARALKLAIKCIPIGITSLVLNHGLESHETGVNACPRVYASMEKPEEIMCDLIAATTIPNGGEKGVALYRTKLETNGNRNGHKGDHPYTKTRIWYHDKVAQLQKLTQKI
jgi:hypothetical protein